MFYHAPNIDLTWRGKWFEDVLNILILLDLYLWRIYFDDALKPW